MEDHKVISQLAEELGCEDIIFKSGEVDADIDVIVSYENFKDLQLGDNFVLLKNRLKCDRHVFYLYLLDGYFYLIDFNIDGLSKPGYFNISMDTINLNIVRKNGIKFLSYVVYDRYRKMKREKNSENVILN